MGPATRLCMIGDGWFLSEFVVLLGQPIFRHFHSHSSLTGGKQTSMSVKPTNENSRKQAGYARLLNMCFTSHHLLTGGDLSANGPVKRVRWQPPALWRHQVTNWAQNNLQCKHSAWPSIIDVTNFSRLIKLILLVLHKVLNCDFYCSICYAVN